jgi:hypothetical protein
VVSVTDPCRRILGFSDLVESVMFNKNYFLRRCKMGNETEFCNRGKLYTKISVRTAMLRGPLHNFRRI